MGSWLQGLGIALAFSTSSGNRLLFLGTSEQGLPKLHQRLIDRPLGLCVTGSSPAVQDGLSAMAAGVMVGFAIAKHLASGEISSCVEPILARLGWSHQLAAIDWAASFPIPHPYALIPRQELSADPRGLEPTVGLTLAPPLPPPQPSPDP